MSIGDHTGFHFLPPSVHLPPVLQPVHGATVMATIGAASGAGPIASAGAVLHHPAVADHEFPLLLSQT